MTEVILGRELESARCLVVEDDLFSRNAVERMLRDLGCATVEIAENGEVAVAKMGVAERSFSIVISDYDMPGMNGLELLKHVRIGARGVRRDVGFIFVTNFSDKPIVGAAFGLDVDCFLLKPVKKSTLRARITSILRNDRPVKWQRDYQAVDIDPETLMPEQVPTDAMVLDDGNGRTPSVAMQATSAGARATGGGDSRYGVMTKVEDITAGSILMQDLYTSSGRLLISNGQVLSDRLLDRLKDLSSIGVNLPGLRIKAPVQRGPH